MEIYWLGGIIVVIALVGIMGWKAGRFSMLTPAPRRIDITVPVSSEEDKLEAERRQEEATRIKVNIQARLQILDDEAEIQSRA